ncbi:PEP-CTERM sorting domain-containing protein [uncultured Massilia sp.]|uniref:PEP-CTERM sorting domain-containing protein n=1 Tax=uncultured Massilia sp. TaxID=169973 RepID=UPI002582A0A1|nr:PEP-CTERM sorting domain-containing protein [uncultured Massilia sp.]
MRFKSLVLASALCLASISSQAGVLYEWRPLNEKLPQHVTFRMEFTTAAVNSGKLNFKVPMGDWEESYPDAGLLSIYFSTPGVSPISYKPREERFRYGLGSLDLNLTFGSDGFLSGRIYANDANSHFGMSSQGSLFTILDARSDQDMGGAGCGENWEICNGATGQLQRVDIPEPGSVALLGIGLLAAAGLRRKVLKN